MTCVSFDLSVLAFLPVLLTHSRPHATLQPVRGLIAVARPQSLHHLQYLGACRATSYKIRARCPRPGVLARSPESQNPSQRPRVTGAGTYILQLPGACSQVNLSTSTSHATACNQAPSRPLPIITAPSFVVPPLPPPESFPTTRKSFFKLHKLRALRRKAKLAGVRTRSDPDTMASPQIPPSPSSSKRSRSRDSARSGTNSSLNTPAAGTPSVSTNSLIIPSSTPGTPSNGLQFVQDGTPYPAFLRLNNGELNVRWNHLELAQLERMRDTAQAQISGSEQPYEYARCNTEEYAPRNRYANVDPYQANRVKLEVPEGHSDYINASPIVLVTTQSQSALKYIATQGPKSDSWSHIWRMIWTENQNPAVVVMLTQTHETGREKCFPYYPQSPSSPDMRINEHDEFEDGFIHNLHLTSLRQDAEARTQVREIDMTASEGDESRKIWHLLFAGWPDFSVPEGADKAALLKLVQISRDKNGDNTTNPRIVHCSAGIGRSGTFIALDWLMQELEEGSLDATPDNLDPIMLVVEKLRDQRAGMVQSKNQFMFLYDAIRERWRERWISTHPSEAAKLGITSSKDSEPALKRQKSTLGDEDILPSTSYVSDAAGATPESRAALEAELQGADMSYEKGKT